MFKLYKPSKKKNNKLNMQNKKLNMPNPKLSTIPQCDNNTIQNNNTNYEFVNHPQHYNKWSVETINMMESIYGTLLTSMWCEMTAFKYATRMGFKPTDTIKQDIDKRDWYLNKSLELKSKLSNSEINVLNSLLNNKHSSIFEHEEFKK